MDFGLGRISSKVFLRYRGDSEDNSRFILYSGGEYIGHTDRLLLHIDFVTAEKDVSTGPRARGTGI